MAAKTFTCVICQAEVSKPQSYAYKDGRACRHHPEVQESHTVAEQAKKDNLEQHKNKPRGFMHQHDPAEHKSLLAHYGMKDPNEHCWSCHEDGVYEHIIMERYLINMSKAELRSSDPIPVFEIKDGNFVPNQQVQEMVRKELGEDKATLRRLDVATDYPDWKLKQVLNKKNQQDKMQLVRMTGMIVLCKECAKEYQFPWPYAHEMVKEKPDLSKMLLVGHLIKPAIDTIAAGEIARDELSVIMNKGN